MSKIPVDPKFGPGTLIQRLTDLWRQLATSHNNNDTTLSGHVGAGGSAHANATTSTAGFMSAADKTLADGWFPNWTSASKTAVVRNINADAALTITTTSAGAGITIDSADATGTTASGALLITTGNTVNQEPGNITIQPGAPSGTAAASTGADVNIIGSVGWRFGGGVFEAGGDALNTGAGFSTGGSFGMTAGAGKKQGGTVAVESGPCNGASGNGGDATLKPNTGAGAGVDGRAIMYDAYGKEVFATGTVSLGGASGFAFMGGAIVAQSTGWGYPTGTTTKTTFDTATVTTAQLAERVKGLIEDMIDRGYLGT